MKTTHAKPVSMCNADLPGIETNHIEMLNRIHRMPCIDVQIKQSHYLWCWQYPSSNSNSVNVTLKGENTDYYLQLSKSALMRDSSQSVSWHDYKTDVACIVFSAVHDVLISIVEQILADQVDVTGVQSNLPGSYLVADQNTLANSVKLGFSIWDDQNSCFAEGALDTSVSHLEKLSRSSGSLIRCTNLAAENVATNVPLLIDFFSLSYAELESLSVSSVIRLKNSSLLEDKTHVVLDIGSQLISADINTTRGNTNYETNSVICADDTKT